MGPIPVASVIKFIFYLARRNAERDGLVWFCCHLQRTETNAGKPHKEHTREERGLGTYNEVLIRLVRGLPPLLPSAHEPPARDDASLDLREVYLHHHAFLVRLAVPHLGHAVTGAADLQEHLALHARLLRRDLQLALFHVARCAPREVRLVLFSLGVGEVGAFVCVER